MVVAKHVVRISFGVSLALVGIVHFMEITSFAESVGRGLDVLEPIGMFWGYLLPGLMIVGGVLIALGFFPAVGALLAGVALASIPAGLMLKSVLSGISLNDTMPPAMNAIIWILFYIAAVRGCHGGHHALHECGCPAPVVPVPKPMPTPAPAPMKAPVAAPKPMIAPKIVAKVPTKKVIPKKK